MRCIRKAVDERRCMNRSKIFLGRWLLIRCGEQWFSLGRRHVSLKWLFPWLRVLIVFVKDPLVCWRDPRSIHHVVLVVVAHVVEM